MWTEDSLTTELILNDDVTIILLFALLKFIILKQKLKVTANFVTFSIFSVALLTGSIMTVERLVLCFRFVICANILFANSTLTDKKVFRVFRHLVTYSLSFSFSGKILWKWTRYSFWPREFSLHFHGDCCIFQQPLVLQTKRTEMQICQYLWPLPTSDHMFWCQLAVVAFSKVVYSCDSAFCNVWPYGRWAVRVDATNCGKMCWSEEDWPGVGLP